MNNFQILSCLADQDADRQDAGEIVNETNAKLTMVIGASYVCAFSVYGRVQVTVPVELSREIISGKRNLQCVLMVVDMDAYRAVEASGQ